MKPRINIITLGVNDLDTALKFYRDGLGFSTEGITDDHVLFNLQNNLHLVLFSRVDIGKAINETEIVHSSTEIMLTYFAESKEEVDEILLRAADAGATVPSPAKQESWGYVGHFVDPDGHVWEVMN